MRKRRKFDGISFYREVAPQPPRPGYEHGYIMIDGVWMRDRVKINGEEPDCPAIDISEFERMLQRPGDYSPFTCTCGIPDDAYIDFPVRCFHKEDTIIMVWRDPLRRVGPCESCEFYRSKGSFEDCPAEGLFFDCPFLKYRYVAHRFRREDIVRELAKLKIVSPQ